MALDATADLVLLLTVTALLTSRAITPASLRVL
jgi:hypothetical protein